MLWSEVSPFSSDEWSRCTLDLLRSAACREDVPDAGGAGGTGGVGGIGGCSSEGSAINEDESSVLVTGADGEDGASGGGGLGGDNVKSSHISVPSG